MKTHFWINKIYLLILTTVLVTGCATTQEETLQDNMLNGGGAEEVTTDIGGDGSGSGSELIELTEIDDSISIPIVEEKTSAQELLNKTDSKLAIRAIYFEFDSAKIRDDSLAMLEEHGNFIAGNGNVSIRLEGHTDERGSREYNIALGDRRAQSVRRVLLFQGASVDQIDTISYGEEQPAMLGHDEAAWSKNRRVELVYEVN